MTAIPSILVPLRNYTFLLLSILFTSCNTNNKSSSSNNTASGPTSIPGNEFNTDKLHTATTAVIDKNIRSIFQDKKGNYWFGTNGAGVYRYDGKTIRHFTAKDGLAGNQVQSIQEDQSGNIFVGTGGFGVSKFDGQNFTTLTTKENVQVSNGSARDWKTAPTDLWFYAGGGAFRYNGSSLVYLPLVNPGLNTINPQSSPYELSSYAVYSILQEKKGTIWFGTQARGVCRFDGQSFTWFTEKGLGGPAVLGLFEDSHGNIWFGNNGAGLFRYDGKTLTNFTAEKKLGNNEFSLAGNPGPGTLARIYSINEDKTGNLWIGTVDAGAWRYDGNTLTNFTTKDGLTSNAINTIYKDKFGELWFGTDGDGMCRFNGKTFTALVVQ
ncbi:MAG: two-component regulator propeller domain-containing protein [Chitinophagaceae bacterium]